MYFNRFDIVEAWFLALAHCHAGQNTREYERLCKIQKYFKRSPFFEETMLTENGKEIYRAACIKVLRSALSEYAED